MLLFSTARSITREIVASVVSDKIRPRGKQFFPIREIRGIRGPIPNRNYTMMKFFWSALFWRLAAMTVSAQTFSTIHTFNGEDGSYPYAGLVFRGGLLYGTTDDGGPAGSRGIDLQP